MDPRSPYEAKYPGKKQGLNKWNWDMNRQGFNCVRDMTLFAGLDGPSVLPGRYTARITAAGESSEASFSLVPDPRVSASEAELQAWNEVLSETASLLDRILSSLGSLREAGAEISALIEDYPDSAELQASGQAALNAIEAWDHQIIQPLHQTYEDEDAWETRLAGQVRFLMDVIDRSGAPLTEGVLERLADLKQEWAGLESGLEDIETHRIAPINAWARDENIPHVSADLN
jgi:hypothetical protein